MVFKHYLADVCFIFDNSGLKCICFICKYKILRESLFFNIKLLFLPL